MNFFINECFCLRQSYIYLQLTVHSQSVLFHQTIVICFGVCN